MKYIKNYKVFENSANLTKDQIDFLDECTNGTWEVNPDTGLIDVQGSFDCNNMELNDFKGLRFGNVSGSFNCENNKLENLDGSPTKVGESFWCRDNPLISLKGAPLEVGRYFWLNSFLNYQMVLSMTGRWQKVVQTTDPANIHYNLDAFLEQFKKDRPGVNELLLTHHFLTPEVIKQKIQEDDKFCIAVGRAWNTKGFENKRSILENPNDPNGLSPEQIQKIKDLSVISGYL